MSSREISRHHANITNIPDLIHENTPFYGQGTHFSVPIHENRHFHGQKKTAQSCLIKEEGAKLRYKISFFMSEAPAVAPGAIVIVALPV